GKERLTLGHRSGTERVEVAAQQGSRLRDVLDRFEYNDSLLVLSTVMVVARQVSKPPHLADGLSRARVHRHDATEHVAHRLQLEDVVAEALGFHRALLSRCRGG